MAKAVVYGFLTTAFVALLLVLASSPSHMGHDGSNNNQLSFNRRLGLRFQAPNFDPLVTQIKREDSGPNKDEAHDPDNKFFDEGGKLNITLRLIVLFPLIDNAPRDDEISFQELEAWNMQQAKDRLRFSTQKEMAYFDKNRDELISLKEYLPHFSDEDMGSNKMEHGEGGWWRQQFLNADADGSGSLSFNEFTDFLHPEDSNNREIHKWMLTEKMKRMDYSRDGKLDLKEFEDHVYIHYKSHVEYENDGKDVPKPEEIFANLDVNKDEMLDIEELIPMLPYLQPGEFSYAKYYTKYLIREADDNKDGKLSMNEMLNHELLFYTTLFEEDDIDDDYFHDEL